jgi:hypothetical protein
MRLKRLLSEYDIQYKKVDWDPSEDDDGMFLASECDNLRNDYLFPAINLATSLRDCKDIRKRLNPRNLDLIELIEKKRQQILNKK